MTNKDDRHDRLIAAFLANLNDIDRHREHEFRQGYPKATDAEIKMLCDADKKAAYPPRSIEHARLILSDNVWVFEPAHDSPYGGSRYSRHDLAGRPPYRPFCAFRDHWRPDDATVPQKTHRTLLRETMKIMAEILADDPRGPPMPGNPPRQKPTAKDFDDAALAAQAAYLQQKALDAIKLGLPEQPVE
jgi:hypothetical protein